MAVVLNGANEVPLTYFYGGAISFNSIPAVVEWVMEKHNNHKNPCLEDIIYWDIGESKLPLWLERMVKILASTIITAVASVIIFTLMVLPRARHFIAAKGS